MIKKTNLLVLMIPIKRILSSREFITKKYDKIVNNLKKKLKKNDLLSFVCVHKLQ